MNLTEFKCFKNSLAALCPTFKMIPPIDACYPRIKYSITAINNYRCNPKLEKCHAVEASISTNSKKYFIMLLMISAETYMLT